MNNQIFFSLYNLSHKSMIFDQVIIFVADTLPYLVVVASVIFLLFHHEVLSSKTFSKDIDILDSFKVFKQKWKEIVLVFFSGVVAWLVAEVIKIALHTPRPFVEFQNVNNLIPETGFAFPSQHATFFMAISFAIFFSHKKAGYIFIFIAFLIGIARVMAGVHFPIDILGGLILGTLIAYLVRFLYNIPIRPTSV